MALVDTHCHLDFEAFESDRDDLVRRCLESDIHAFVVPGVSRGNWAQCLALSSRYPSVKCALGLYPYFVSTHEEQDLETLQKTLSDPRVVALGEIGLDEDVEDFDRQCFFFERQLEIAESLSLPVIMHVRRNQGQGLKRVKRHNLIGGVVHAFSGSVEEAEGWLDLGMMIGVGGVITYERAIKTRRTIASLPLNRLVLETDSPDMAVQGTAKGEGTPLMLRQVFDVLCDIRNEPRDEIEFALWDNASRLFSL